MNSTVDLSKDRPGTNTPRKPERRTAALLPVLIVATTLAAAIHGVHLDSSPTAMAASQQEPGQLNPSVAREGRVTIATAKLIIEYNSTDDDIGVHGAFDDHGWSTLSVFDPNGSPVLSVKPKRQLKGLTIAGVFFESREPPSSEFSFDDLKRTFPEGQYQVRGTTFDGQALTGAATFTHDVPAAPTVTHPLADATLPATGVVIEWEDVTETIDGRPIQITGYEIIITKEAHNDPNGFSRPIFDVHVPPDRNRLPVPVEFLEPGTQYELEVLALEVSGNQTIAVSFFSTE